MAKLVLSINGKIAREHELDRGSLSIGRDQSNDICIDNPSVSSKHAKVLTILNESFIEDLDSTNGTYVNGSKITGHALKNGDSIFIGKHELSYINDEAKKEKSKAGNIAKKHTENKSVTRDDKSNNDTSTTEPGAAKLQVLTEPNAGKELQLTKIINTVGKPDEQVAAVLRRPAGYYLIVVDAGKENKMPLINGAEIDKQELLIDGDIIEVAGVQMRFHLI